MSYSRPTRDQIQAAQGRTLPDVLAPNLRVLLCGINPGLYSAAIGCHFGRPGNRFWPALHLAGITPRQLSPCDQFQLLDYGVGVTNIAPRATARADELTAEELRAGATALEAKVHHHRPALLAVLGITAYRQAFRSPKAVLGLQPHHRIGPAAVWVLPNPSGLNAHYQLPDLANLFREMWQVAGCMQARQKVE